MCCSLIAFSPSRDDGASPPAATLTPVTVTPVSSKTIIRIYIKVFFIAFPSPSKLVKQMNGMLAAFPPYPYFFKLKSTFGTSFAAASVWKYSPSFKLNIYLLPCILHLVFQGYKAVIHDNNPDGEDDKGA